MKKFGAVMSLTLVLLAVFSLAVFAQGETPPVEEIMESPETLLKWLVGGGAAYIAGMFVSILCWMSPKFDALPSEKKRIFANVTAVVVSLLAQATIMLFVYKPDYLLSLESIWKFIASAVISLVGLNITYLRTIRQQPAVIYQMAPPVE